MFMAAAVLSATADEKTGTASQGSGAEVARIGVIAADERGSFGYAIGYKMGDANQARSDALAGCGNPGCKIVVYAPAVCVALADARRADGAYWYWVAYGARSWDNGRMDVREQVLQWCRGNAEANAAGCKLQINECQK